MRKFKVSFEVETDNEGFVAARMNKGRLTAEKPESEHGPYPAAVIPADAVIEEITPMKDGYYYARGELYRRLSGAWRFRSGNNWEPCVGWARDSQHRTDFYVGPLRDRECDG